MENKLLKLPEIVPLEYNGQKVLTSIQLAASYHCLRQNISDNFRHHKDDFILNVDYFYLTGAELREFKSQNQAYGQKSTCLPPSERQSDCPISPLASSLYLWTKSGTLKHSHFLKTEKGKEVFDTLSKAYFGFAQAKLHPEQMNLFSPKSDELSTREKINLLNSYINKCTDKNLRDALIKEAYELLTGKTI